jgi:DNA-binding response OmpR family regulator
MRPEAPSTSPGPRSGSRSSAQPRMPPATILLVDDDAASAAVLEDVLRATGYQVVVVGTGADAKRLLIELRPDLVILDIMLPDADGLVLCSALRQLSAVPIIVCSGTTRMRDATLARRLGADDFIAKPYDLHDLAARLAG